MATTTFRDRIVGMVIGLLMVPLGAAAQSTISGSVRDTSGAVLPGVSVEASSEVLIEKARSVVTDEQGRYSIVDLRPGTYQVIFTLQGFSKLQRDGIELPANFNASVNVELAVGALEETVTVSGASPIVDVQSSQKTVNLRREVLDALPTSRTYAAEGSLAVGVKVVAQNVGGARIAAQQRLYVHGAAAADNTVAVDGMSMNSTYSNGETQPNHNDSMTQEVTVQTSSPGAEVSGGGLFINLIPKEGGNTFSGSSFIGYTNNSFQGDNLTPELVSKGLTTGDGVEYIYDVNASLGGPIARTNDIAPMCPGNTDPARPSAPADRRGYREVLTLAGLLRVRRAMDGRADLDGDRLERSPDDAEGDRIDRLDRPPLRDQVRVVVDRGRRPAAAPSSTRAPRR